MGRLDAVGPGKAQRLAVTRQFLVHQGTLPAEAGQREACGRQDQQRTRGGVGEQRPASRRGGRVADERPDHACHQGETADPSGGPVGCPVDGDPVPPEQVAHRRVVRVVDPGTLPDGTDPLQET